MITENNTTQNPGSSTIMRGIRLADLSLRLGSSDLITDMSETFDVGTWTCILGPSGVGKSLLLRAILGLIDPHSHSDITVSGNVYTTNGNEPLTGYVSYMAQQDLLFPWLTVRQNIELGTSLRGQQSCGADSQKTEELLKAVGLDAYADTLPDRLSGGMRQRAALARTLKENTPIVIMDEPFSAVDAITRLRLQDMASEFLTGRTVIMVTHDPLEALRLGHNVRVLRGRPAAFEPAIAPPACPPRSVESPDILEMQGRLLTSLQGSGI